MKILNSFFVFSLFFFGSCRRNDIGGDANLKLQIMHHNSPINNSVAYVSFDAIEMPKDPETNYDLKVQGNATNNFIEVNGLRAGQYYIYVVGFDSGINLPVRGGIPIEIKWKERKSFQEILIPVVE